ncbi:hypothetical protein CkaCkLH20_02068 [Colletotrichum karsti]|uniref:Apple domain-containing protein n=1 Tax=Colletotrichum karsti TaxID=1095194 RepID=A0A9P6IC50_9PEZI|nr:uncharacterized protein CkaCkLH20_02068 [Colletotrichum karsti]KAF9880114.1 hypothetical protein CkaCkLH20_02068 [Colletotrichum karsti]
MLKNPNGSPGPEAGAIPDGLEVHPGPNFNDAPQPYLPQMQQHNMQPQHHQQPAYYDHNVQTPQTQYSHTTYTNNHHPAAVPPPGKEGKEDARDGRICGLRKPTFFLTMLSVVLLATLIAVAGALGAVVAQKNSQLARATASAAPTSTGASATPTATSAAVLNLAEAAPTDTAIKKGECPTGSTKPKWEVPGTNITFEKDCGSDYIYNDIGKVPTTNIEECVRLCAVFNLNKQTELGRCAGIVYLYKDDQGNDDPYCWMKYTKNTNQILSKDYTESAWIV